MTMPLEFVVPLTGEARLPPLTVTVAPFTGNPAQLTVATSVPVGSARETLVVEPPVTDWPDALMV